MKKLLLVLTIICMILPSCKKTTITLSVDKTEITADGVDVAKFKVIANDEDDVTKDARIFFSDTNKEVGGTTFSTTEPKTYSFYATYEDATSEKVTVTAVEVTDEGGNDEGDDNGDDDGNDDGNDDDDDEEENPVETAIVLSASADTILADGKDVIKFTAVQDSADVTSLAKFYVNDSLLSGNEFTTTVAGSYSVVAKKNDTIVSNEVKFFAKAIGGNDEENEEEGDEEEGDDDEDEIVVTLSANVTTIIADGEDAVVFSVKADTTTLTEGYQILNTVDNSVVENGIFTTKEVGTYTFVAIYNEIKSNELTVEAQAVEVVLKASKTAVKNDGKDEATFTVLVNGKDRTAESVILNMTFGGVYEGTTFSSERTGDHAFKAKWNEYESEMVVINVYEALAYKPGDLYDVNGVKGVVFYVEEDGKSGLIMSMDQEALAWSTEEVWVNCVTDNGVYHTEDMLKFGAENYPAAKWCVEHGEGWYFPSSEEMQLMWTAVSDSTHVFDPEFIKLYNDKLEDPILEDFYWSSNEVSFDIAEAVAFMERSVVCLSSTKSTGFYVRAVRKF